VLVTLAGLLVVIGVLTLLFGERAYSGYIYPNISVRGIDLSYQHSGAAKRTIQEHYINFLQQPVELVYGDRVWKPTASELGVYLDIDTTLRDALTLGRDTSRVESARTVASIWEQGVDLPLRLVIDQQAMQRYLLEIAQEVERTPTNADLALEGADVVVTQEEDGMQVLVDETMNDITLALQDLEQRQVHLRTRALAPQMRDTDIAGAIFGAHTMLDGPITLVSSSSKCAPDCRWVWSPELLARWIHLDRSVSRDGHPQVTVRIDQAALQRALVPVANALQRDGALPRVAWNGGDLAIIEPGTAGYGLDASLALVRIHEALQGGSRTIELPLSETPPPIIAADLDSLDITQAVGVGVSSFRASQSYRITNIQAGARRMNGILIPPGGAFSFNEALGVVDARNGFVIGSAIVQNRTQQEWGGGLCQVSTTMFRAAFWSGLPIAERHAHTFRIAWYEELGEPPGLDATIFTGVNDLQFTNDTGGWLLTQAFVDLNSQRLTVIIYGQPTQRSVQMSHRILSRTPALRQPIYIDDPSRPRGTVKQTDWAQPGLHVQVYRTVQEGGQIIRQDVFDSVFEPWPDIYLRGTG
jgi:vancomycin resistance protein YoaR